MADNVITKPLGLVLIAAAHMLFGPSGAVFFRTKGNNITLNFTFNDTGINNNSNFNVYLNTTKIVQYTKHSRYMLGDIFKICQNTTIQYHISSLELNHSGFYWVALFPEDNAKDWVKESNKLQLIVQMENSTGSTVGPLQINTTTTAASERPPSSFHMIMVLVISLLLLAVAFVSLLTCGLLRVKAGRQQQHITQQNSNATSQDTANVSNCPPRPPLVYSVLDFPKRPAATSVNSDDTEYANISPVQGKMHSSMQTQ